MIWYGAVLRADEGALDTGREQQCAGQRRAPLRPRRAGRSGQKRHGWPQRHRPTAARWGTTASSGCMLPSSTTPSWAETASRGGALVPEGMVIPDNSVAVGVPAGSSRPSGTTSWPTTSRTQKPMWRWAVSTRRCEILRCILRRTACTTGFSMLSSSQNRARPARTEV